MQIEPGYAADGSVSGWLCYHQGQYLGSISRTKPRRWQVNDPDCAVVGVFKTRKAAFAVLHARMVGTTYAALRQAQ